MGPLNFIALQQIKELFTTGHPKEALEGFYGTDWEIDARIIQLYLSELKVLWEQGKFELGEYRSEIRQLGMEIQDLLEKVERKLWQETGRFKDNYLDTKLYSLDAYCYRKRGDMYLQLKAYRKALTDYHKAIELEPDIALNYGKRAYLYKELYAYDRALKDSSKAITLDAQSPSLYIFRGNLFRTLQKYETALADYSMAIEIDPNYANAYYFRANLLSDFEAIEGALADYNKAIELDPYDLHAFRSRGELYKKLGDSSRAFQDLSKARSLEEFV